MTIQKLRRRRTSVTWALPEDGRFLVTKRVTADDPGGLVPRSAVVVTAGPLVTVPEAGSQAPCKPEPSIWATGLMTMVLALGGVVAHGHGQVGIQEAMLVGLGGPAPMTRST